MGRSSNPNVSFEMDISNQSHTIIHENDLQTSPLDLSQNSIRFPYVHQATSTDDLTTSPTDLPVKNSHMDSRQMSIDCSFEEPTILRPPKSEWHYRSTRDLAKKHIPLLAGEGPQRTPIIIKVPEKSDQPMYLGIAVVTDDGQFHDSKVIVPAKTKVDKTYRSHDNNLNCLKFDECNLTDRFDIATRHVYLQITRDEHKAQSKEVRIHMFNLYQNNIITKDIIEAKQLHLCRLAFWFCFFDNNHYIPVSERSLSCNIRQKKISTRSNVLQQITASNQMNSINSYSKEHTDYFNQDDINDDDDDDDDDDDNNDFLAVSINKQSS